MTKFLSWWPNICCNDQFFVKTNKYLAWSSNFGHDGKIFVVVANFHHDDQLFVKMTKNIKQHEKGFGNFYQKLVNQVVELPIFIHDNKKLVTWPILGSNDKKLGV